MSLEVFVRASGAVMGLARDSFSLDVGGGAGVGSGSVPVLAGAVSGSGQAVSAFNNASTVLDGQVSALGEQDVAATSGLQSALTAAGAGRDQMEAVIGAALGDINRLAATTTAPAGQQALVNALASRLEQTWQTLTNGNADASTRAASSAQLAAGYSGLGNYQGTAIATTAPTSSLSAMSPIQSASMMQAATMAANQAAISQATQLASTQQLSTTQQPTTPNNSDQTATLTRATTDSNGVRTVVQRAMKELGVPYSWGGGGSNGPTLGLQSGPGAHTVGFDCSGLVQYAYAPYVHLPRTTYQQINVGRTVSPSDIQAGDLIFSYFGEDGDPGPGHVQLAISHTQVVEAPYTGADVRVSGLAPGRIVVKRILG